MSKVVKCADFKPEAFFSNVCVLKNRRGNPAGKKRHYLALTTAFDIETSLIPGTEQSVMYIWQWQLGTEYTVIGRTWQEFINLQLSIKECIPDDTWIVCYVHNLSFEFQYLKGIYKFLPSDVFAVASRKIVKCDMHNCFEFRCSYKLTNMSLGEFTEKMNVEHKKLSGEEFDYSVVRYWFTEMTDTELQYCINDVLGLVEAVNALMKRDGDTLQTIPLTSTGYVRRNAKRAMKKGVHHNLVYSMLPDLNTYEALKEAFRGGNCHSNRFMAGDIVYNVHSADRSSSYPAVICNCEFPMTEFVSILKKDLNFDYIIRCMKIRHKALLLRIGIKNLNLRDYYWGCPYISKSKCRNIHKAIDTEDNGRILSADYIETTVTDIDLQIICKEYTGEIIILEGWYSSYKKLPQPLIEEVKKYYTEKTELKGVTGQEVYYDKAKALLNSLYGMMAQDSVKEKLIFQQIGEYTSPITDIKNDPALTIEEKREAIKAIKLELLGESNRKAFLAYQWGVWVTAWARLRLEEGIRLVHETEGANFVYCDTDSVKYTGAVNWDQYNHARVLECAESGSYATDTLGITHYMGVFETEDNPKTGYAYYQFKTLGAKKYAYVTEKGGPCKATIAGVNKKKGGQELDKHGGLSAFAEGFVFKEAGGNEAVYNDAPEISEIQVDGYTVPITSNVSILPSEYTLGIEGEYARIIKYAKNYLDNPHII